MNEKTQIFFRNGGETDWIVADEPLDSVERKIKDACMDNVGCIKVHDQIGQVLIMVAAIEQCRRTR